MNTEIVYVCNSTNNKNVRANELKILRVEENNLCFEFGQDEHNIKIRYYNNLEDLRKDVKALEEIKAKLEEDSKKELDNSKNKKNMYKKPDLF